MENIYGKVKKYIAQYQMISEKDVVAAGISGGADSVCLLLMLYELSKELDFRLLAVHVHHGVRAEADQDADYVKHLCRELHVPFFLRRVDMNAYAKENVLSPEEAGRALRYQAFEEVLAEQKRQDGQGGRCGAYKIAVAHNHNDRAETMLFHLFRGSGLKGLSGIRPVREKVIRPLLCLERAEIEVYLKERKVTFCIDSTNDDDTYTRNKIRHHILAYAESDICRNVTAHINEAADILTEAEDFLAALTESVYERCKGDDDAAILPQEVEDTDYIVLDLDIFKREDIYIQKRVFLRCIEQLTPYRQNVTAEHVHNLLELTDREGCKELSLPYQIAVYKEYNRLIFQKKSESFMDSAGWGNERHPGEPAACPVSVPGEVQVPGLGVLEFQYIEEKDFFYKNKQIIPQKTYTKWFDYDKITTVLVLRTRKA
ncbi:MAG: tRNA lysidine(34) synthetase TilS, partial [Roseburia sp.]|nr:tRNA lysidine(34) synthetase TilS [Roseburia sp.]